ncbi:STAS domain-containing protein [Streptomyces coeruleorubidus]|uniref:STAS domain-containing protein n=1 Tax=Streptomyces coeruleorubidus TaxID=116188 RepID=UPI00366A007D
MPLPQLNVHRHDHTTRTLIVLAGEIDLATAPLVHAALAACVHDGVRTTDVDLTAVTFCDASGINAFLTASRLATDAGMTLRLHGPPPAMARIIELTGSAFLLHEPLTVRTPSRRFPAATRSAVRVRATGRGDHGLHRACLRRPGTA